MVSDTTQALSLRGLSVTGHPDQTDSEAMGYILTLSLSQPTQIALYDEWSYGGVMRKISARLRTLLFSVPLDYESVKSWR